MRNLIFRIQFYFASHLHEWLLSQKCREVGYPVAYPRILINLERQGSMNQRQLAQECLMQPSGLTRVIKDMEEDGLVMRSARGWRGEISIEITEKGREIYREIEKAFSEIDDLVVEGITDEEMACFAKVLDKVVVNMQKESLRMGTPFFNRMFPLEKIRSAVK